LDSIIGGTNRKETTNDLFRTTKTRTMKTLKYIQNKNLIDICKDCIRMKRGSVTEGIYFHKGEKMVIFLGIGEREAVKYAQKCSECELDKQKQEP